MSNKAGLKKNDIAVIIKSRIKENIGKLVKIIDDDYSVEGQTFDVLVESLLPEGLDYIAEIDGDDGEPEYLTFPSMQLGLTSTNLQKIADGVRK